LQLAVRLKETYISFFGNTIRFEYIEILIRSFYTCSQYKTYFPVSIYTLLFFDGNVEGQSQSSFEKETIKEDLKSAALVVFLAMINVLVGINQLQMDDTNEFVIVHYHLYLIQLLIYSKIRLKKKWITIPRMKESRTYSSG
jgi:hypothetical protein